MWSMDQKFKVPELWDAYCSFDWHTGNVDEPGDIPPAETARYIGRRDRSARA